MAGGFDGLGEMRISDNYLDLQKQLHATGTYGRGVDVPECMRHIRACIQTGETLLDYGCGQGHLGRACADWGLPIFEYDPAIPGKDKLPAPADIVVCADVLEHVEPECLDAVLNHLQALTRKILIAVIATRPAAKTLADGRNAHVLLLEPKEWFDHLVKRFDMLQWADRHVIGRGVLFIGGSRHE